MGNTHMRFHIFSFRPLFHFIPLYPKTLLSSLASQQGTLQQTCPKSATSHPPTHLPTKPEDFWKRWRRQLLINAAYAPLTIHWSLEKGLVGEFWVGLFGSVAGLAKLKEAWRLSGISG